MYLTQSTEFVLPEQTEGKDGLIGTQSGEAFLYVLCVCDSQPVTLLKRGFTCNEFVPQTLLYSRESQCPRLYASERLLRRQEGRLSWKVGILDLDGKGGAEDLIGPVAFGLKFHLNLEPHSRIRCSDWQFYPDFVVVVCHNGTLESIDGVADFGWSNGKRDRNLTNQPEDLQIGFTQILC